MKKKKKIVIIGAGPSGLSVSWGLAEKEGFEATILEKSDTVGGLARTVSHKGLRFDIGPHRLSPQLPEVVKVIKDLLGDDLLEKKNTHGVYLHGNFYHYPPGLNDFLKISSLLSTTTFGMSWLSARITDFFRDKGKADEEWAFDEILKRYFGNKFYYEVIVPMIHKVWGTTDLHHDFARIRFELPTFTKMIRRIFIKGSKVNNDVFYYPVNGFSQIWDTMKTHIEAKGHRVELASEIKSIDADSLDGPFTIKYRQGGKQKTLTADTIVSSISNKILLGYFSKCTFAKDLPSCGESFNSRTLRLGIILVKGIHIPARVVIFPESRFIFNRISEMNQFADLGYPDGTSLLMIDVICDKESEYDTMESAEFDRLLLKSFLSLGWCSKEDVSENFNISFPGAYPVLTQARYEAQDKVESFFNGSGVLLCGREASTDYNNAHNAIGKGFLAARYLAGEFEFDDYRKLSQTIGRLPIQD